MINQGDNQPNFNLKAVVKETGIKPDTLRAWERRYGIPKPIRTEGGHRLYTQADIETLKWLLALQSDGVTISHAVKIWNQYVDEGKDPLVDMPLKSKPEMPSIVIGDIVTQHRNAWHSACMNFDEQKAELIISQALSMYPVEVVCVEIMQKGLSQIGMDWYDGKVTPQQEHFASALAMRRLESLVAATPAPINAKRILIGCSPEEEHTFSPLLLTLLLRRRGFEALYLGANVPLARLESTIASVDPSLVIFTAQTLYTASTLLGMAELLQKEGMPFAFGGLIFNMLPDLQKRIPGWFLGEALQSVPEVLDQLKMIPQDMEVIKPDERYIESLNHFIMKQARIKARVWDLLEGIDVQPTHLARANREFSRNIIAALSLGDMNLLGQDIEWVEGLLHNYHYRMPKEVLRAYIGAYYQATKEVLNGRGAVIWEWLEQLIEKPSLES